MKTTAYLRISTVDQDIEKNKSDILKLANEKRLGYVEFIEEQISGKVSWRNRKIFAIINEAKKDDVIIVSELSRLGRSMLEIMEILSAKIGLNRTTMQELDRTQKRSLTGQ